MRGNVRKLKVKPALIEAPAEGPLRLWLGIGREEGWVKLGPGTVSPDYALDTKAMPWPVAEGSVDEIRALFYYHRLSLWERFRFMDECWRVLKPGGQLTVVVPHYASVRAYSDPWACWPPVTEAAFEWFARGWREREAADDLGLTCDFTFGVGYQPQSDYLAGRNEEFSTHAMAHEWNVLADIHATLVAVK